MNYKLPAIFFFALILTSFAQTDSLPIPEIEFSTDPPEIVLSNMSVSWVGNYIPTIIFFEPGSDLFDDGYRAMLGELAARLAQNPDIECEVRGFYSPKYDKINSPVLGEDIAYRRASEVREALLLSQSQLSLKASVATKGFELTQPYLLTGSEFDARVEILIKIPGWSPRMVVSSEELPYWRRGFRNLADEQSAFIKNILERNPDLVLLFSAGILDVNPVEAHKRIAVVSDYFSKKMEWDDPSRFCAVSGGNAKPGEMTIDLVPLFIAPEPLCARIFKIEPAETSIPTVILRTNADEVDNSFLYRINFKGLGANAPIKWGIGESPARFVWQPLADSGLSVFGSGDVEIMLYMHGGKNLVSKTAPIKISLLPPFSENASIPIIPFKTNSIIPTQLWEPAIIPVVEKILWLIEQKGNLKIKIVGHALETESDSIHSAGDFAQIRAEILKEKIEARLMSKFDKENEEDFSAFLIKKNITVETETQIHCVSDSEACATMWGKNPVGEIPWSHVLAWMSFASIKLEFTNGN